LSYYLTRTGLREILEEKISKIPDVGHVRRVLVGTPGTEYSVGVGTPYLAEIQDEGIGPYILFTGWDHRAGDYRKVFVGEIDEDFEISNIRKIIDAGDPSANYRTHMSVSAFYEPYLESWLVFTTALDETLNYFIVCLFEYDKEFQVRKSVYAPLKFTDDTIIRASDSSFSPLRNQRYTDVFFAYIRRESGGPEGIYSTWWGEAFDATLPPSLPSENRVLPFIDIRYGGFLIDYSHLTVWKDWYLILAGEFSNGSWNIRPCFVHGHSDYTKAPLTGVTDSFMGIAGWASEAILPPLCSHHSQGYDHPHLSWLPDKNLNLFFITLPNNHPSYKHEIWSVRISPEHLDPKNYRALIYIPWYNDSIAANDTSRAFPGYGRVTIYFKSDTAGDLTIEVDPLGDGDWETLDTFSNVTSVKKMTEYSGNSMRLKFSQAATVTAKVIVEAGK